jgi:hypothetical protein
MASSSRKPAVSTKARHTPAQRCANKLVGPLTVVTKRIRNRCVTPRTIMPSLMAVQYRWFSATCCGIGRLAGSRSVCTCCQGVDRTRGQVRGGSTTGGRRGTRW